MPGSTGGASRARAGLEGNAGRARDQAPARSSGGRRFHEQKFAPGVERPTERKRTDAQTGAATVPQRAVRLLGRERDKTTHASTPQNPRSAALEDFLRIHWNQYDRGRPSTPSAMPLRISASLMG